MKENRLFHNNKLKRIQRDYGDLGVFVAGGVAALARRDKSPEMLDIKFLPTVFDHIVGILLGAPEPGASAPLIDIVEAGGAPEPGALAPHGAPEPQKPAICCTDSYNGSYAPGAPEPSGAPEPGASAPVCTSDLENMHKILREPNDRIGTAYQVAISEITRELGAVEKPDSMTDAEALEYLSRKKVFASKVRRRVAEILIATPTDDEKSKKGLPHTPSKEQIKELEEGKGGPGENPKLRVDIPDEPVLQVTAIDKKSPTDMIPPHQLFPPFVQKNKIVVECPKELKEIADNGSIPENFAAYYLSQFPGKTDAVDEFSTFVSWHSSKGTKYKDFYRTWITWVLKKKKGFQKNWR